jgi:hypothetical protein
VLSPGCDGVRLIKPHCASDGLPQPLHVRLAKDRARPPFVRVRDDRPGDTAVAGRREYLLRELAWPRLGDAGAVEIGEQLRLRIARDGHERAVRLREVVDQRE